MTPAAARASAQAVAALLAAAQRLGSQPGEAALAARCAEAAGALAGELVAVCERAGVALRDAARETPGKVP